MSSHRLYGIASQERAREGLAYGVLRECLEPGETGIFLGTAHPAKFLPVYERLGITVPLPAALAALGGLPLRVREIPNGFAALRAVLEGG